MEKKDDATMDTLSITIGWMGPLTGDAASIGRDALAASHLAIEEVNAAGGVNGRMLELIAEDSQCSPKEAANAGNKLIAFDQVKFIVGGICSGETTAIAPVAEKNKVVVFSGCSSASSITIAGDYIFRSYPSDAFQGTVAADYIFNTLGKKHVAVLAVIGEWGTGVKMVFENNFRSLGGTIVSSEDYTQDNRDFRTSLTKVKESGAELLYFVGYTEATNAGLEQARDMDLTIPMFGTDAWNDPKIHENPFANGIMYTVSDLSAKAEDWIAKLAVKGASNTVCAPGSYNNIYIFADIMRKVGTDTEAVKNGLYGVVDYPGVNGSITLDKNGDLAGANYDVKVVGE